MLAAVLVAPLIAPGSARSAVALQPSTASCLSANEAQLLDRINTVRRIEGLPQLVASPTLSAAARYHAESMATWNYFPDDYSVRTEGEADDDTMTWQENIARAGYPDN